MKERLRRTVTVDAPLSVAWNYLAVPEDWPRTWARHLRSVKCSPPGQVSEGTRGVVQMRQGFKSRMRMKEFSPENRWKWASRSRLGSMAFDHQFRAMDEQHTQIDFVVETAGLAEPVLGRLTAVFLGRKLDRNLPRLVADLNEIGRQGI